MAQVPNSGVYFLLPAFEFSSIGGTPFLQPWVKLPEFGPVSEKKWAKFGPLWISPRGLKLAIVQFIAIKMEPILPNLGRPYNIKLTLA